MARARPAAAGLRPGLATMLILAGAAPAARAAPAVYQLDPAHSFVTFEVLHFGTATLRGRIGPLQGQVQLDREAARGEVRLTIPVDTVDTGVPALDARLRGPSLFDTAQFPQAWFVATQFRFAAGGALQSVRGEFTLHGRSQGLTLEASRFSCRQEARLSAEVCGGDFTADLDRSDHDLTFGLPFVPNRVHLLVQVEGVRQAGFPPPAPPPSAPSQAGDR